MVGAEKISEKKKYVNIYEYQIEYVTDNNVWLMRREKCRKAGFLPTLFLIQISVKKTCPEIAKNSSSLWGKPDEAPNFPK